MTLLITILLIMTIFMAHNTCGSINNLFYLSMTFLKMVNKKNICSVALINVISKTVISKVFLSIVVVSNLV
jgi:hypothetical protein